MTNLDSEFKSRDVTLPTKVCIGKAMVFPVVMYGCESWTIKKAAPEELMILNYGLLRVPWTARRSNQSIIKEINPEYSLEELILKLKLQYFGHLMQKANSLEKTLMLGKIEGRRWSGQQRIRWWMASLKRATKDKMVDGITDSMDMNLSKFREIVRNRETWCAEVNGVTKSQAQLGD